MKITKFGHSCLLVEESGVRILTDPGIWNALPDVEQVDAILITHEHPDHCDITQLKSVLEKNPKALVITQKAVGKILDAEGIAHTLITDGEKIEVKGVSVESVGTQHAIIYGDVSPCQNTGYVIADKLFAPGDALHDVPKKPIEILALPTGGPWMRLSEAIEYVKKLKPKMVFPIHDAMYIEAFRGPLITRIVGSNIESADTVFRDVPPGSTSEF